MKQKILFVCLLGAISSTICGKTLQPFYFDNPEAATRHTEEMSEEQAAFFAQYEYVTQQVSEGADIASYFMIERATDEADSVPSLLKNIMYDQREPYNRMCPVFSGQHAATGCVATAMAQVMRYYSFPKVGSGEVTYTGSHGAKTINLADYVFDWDLILDTYRPGKYTDAQGDAVAELMLACGASLNMNYGVDGSGSYIQHAMKALKKNFGYTAKMEYYESLNDHDPEGLIEGDWAPTIRQQHRLGFPVFYSGCPASGKAGHAFVLDGYKVIDGVYYYHVNWGWSGELNGYYLLMNLNPQGENYSGYACDMVINIYPEGMGVENVPVWHKDKLYNVLGVEVDENYKGIVIKNGKKYLQ